MAESDLNKYCDTLMEALLARKNWLETSELPQLKDALRSYHASFSSMYTIFLKKKLIHEDPYKQEAKISELEIPEVSSFIETKRMEQISIRLATYDNQLDFLSNFYQLSVDMLNMEQIKRILGLIRYIDWVALTPDSQSPNTKAVAEMTQQAKSGLDQITLSVVGESLTRLSKATVSIVNNLKDLTGYFKENYKLNVRNNITKVMPASEVNAANIKKKFPVSMPRMPFYQELIDEIIREDYTEEGTQLRQIILKSLEFEEEKPKAVKPQVNYKNILLEGTQVIGGASIAMVEIGEKLDENADVLLSQKKGFVHAIKQLIRQMTKAEPEDIFYNIEYTDQTKGVTVKEKLNFRQFRDDFDRKTKILSSFVRGPAATKLAAMSEEQIIGHLEKNIRDVQTIHKVLNSLDDYFKSAVPVELRDKIKGIKPELSTMKNSIVKANQLRYDYSSQKEEEQQLKRLGISASE